MTQDIFMEKVRNEIKEVLPEGYENSRVRIIKIYKNNLEKHAIEIENMDGQQAIPVVYLDVFYDEYLEGRDFYDILNEIAEIRIKSEDDVSIDVQMLMDFEQVKTQVIPCIVGTERNQKFLSGKPYK